MARVLSETTYRRMMGSIGVTEGLPTESRMPSVRRIRSTGGGDGGTRSYVIITAVTDPANYIGNVITSPEDPTVVTADVAIKVSGATANEFEIGYSNFADKSGDIYYLSGGLLG